jgi:hypothetical protein
MDTVFDYGTVLRGIEENGCVEVPITDVANYASKQPQAVEIFLRELYTQIISYST